MLKDFRVLSGLTIAVLLAGGCRSAEEYEAERFSKVPQAIEKITNGKVLPEGTVLTLQDCMRMAIENNRDLRVYEQKQKVAKEKIYAEVMGMLPDLTVTNDITGRNNTPASSSENVTGGTGGTYSASQSSDRNVNNLKVEMALSALDFGLSYLNAAQAEDYSLIEDQQLRRAKQNLMLDVVRTYYRVAATQDAIETTNALLEKCKQVEVALEDLAQNRTLSPLRLSDEAKRFYRLEKQLMEYRRNYNNACIELRALMGYLPISDIKVDTSLIKNMQIKELPDINLLEKIALTQRPELYQLDIQTNIMVNESRKTLLMMFPNVKAFVDWNNSNNSFLYHQSWWEIGAVAAYNLLKLPQNIYRYRAQREQVNEIDERTLALSIGVMSQVRIAHANIIEVKEQFELDDKIAQKFAMHAKMARESYKAGGALTQLELDRLELEAAEAEIDRMLSLSNYYVAYQRLINAVGVDNIDPETVGLLEKKIAEAEAKEHALSEREKQAIANVQNSVKDNGQVMFKGVVVGENTLSPEMRDRLNALVPQEEADAAL
ncbi:TolC family protein [Victivallis sp. Marseille-Q1083]|uniref:TolC family protein n=1 Tax=Victivallis sp. Marseille-Q1083 TaxID=2717288 RepID=UPI001589DCE8|nr:TolC family protein [Victivallis sp. Marseille-Q1083]